MFTKRPKKRKSVQRLAQEDAIRDNLEFTTWVGLTVPTVIVEREWERLYGKKAQ